MNLFDDFSPASADQWKKQIEKDLKGKPFESLLNRHFSGVRLQPFYTEKDRTVTSDPLFGNKHWDICEQINVKDETSANLQALAALEGGASGLSFYIHKKVDAQKLLQGISLEHIHSQFFISNDALPLLDDLKNFYRSRNEFDGKYKCYVNLDPLCLLAFYGEWHKDQYSDLGALQNFRHISVNFSLFQEAGAEASTELAAGLSQLNEYITYFNEHGGLKDKSLYLIFSVASNFFGEIAKLRAFRKLLALLLRQYNLDLPFHVHVQTAQLNKSALDMHTNMLRTTTEAMSAVIGGCDSLAVLPFDYGFAENNAFSNRVARNQQHILKEEVYLDKVADISAGSYYIEHLTESLAAESWKKFKELEAQGGFVKCIERGLLQDMIAREAEAQINEVKNTERIMIGVNKYPDAKAKVPSKLFSVNSRNSGNAPYKRLLPIRLAYTFEEEKMRSETEKI